MVIAMEQATEHEASSSTSHSPAPPLGHDSAPFRESTRDATIFVVDDERLIAFTLSTILLQHGYRTLWFTDPRAAMEAAIEHAPAVLITDYNMPAMSGTELARVMRSVCPECKIVLISAQVDVSPVGDRIRREGQGMVTFAKPIRIEPLLAEVSRLLQPIERTQRTPHSPHADS